MLDSAARCHNCAHWSELKRPRGFVPGGRCAQDGVITHPYGICRQHTPREDDSYSPVTDDPQQLGLL